MDFYNKQSSVWNDGLEELKKKIKNPKIKIVSFDIFDTLLLRPLLNPKDVFNIVECIFHRNYPEYASLNFRSIREHAESVARAIKFEKDKNIEDITIDEIYEVIRDKYHYSRYVAKTLRKLEEDVEYKLIKPRNTGKQLLQFAHKMGKKVILVSDMYLTKDIIIKILDNIGIKEYSKLYLSSDIGCLKHSGRLFKYVLQDLNCSPSQILHIGDNEYSDIECAQQVGIEAYELQRTTALKENCPVVLRNIFKYYAAVAEDITNYDATMAARISLAMSVNKVKDNPFDNIQTSPYLIGYSIIGITLLSNMYKLAKSMLA